MDSRKKTKTSIGKASFLNFYSMVIVVYFAMTTLATVGYGDYHAVND